jgi:hypothetical protein
MKSPFPGMDPYLELSWRDVYATLIVYFRDHLQPQLGGDLRARVEERLVVESPLDEEREIYPDLRVFESERGRRPGGKPAGAVATIEPIIVPCPDDEKVETFIQIIDRKAGDRVVTVIELLSPSNKLRGDSRRKYREKQKELYEAKVNLIEIDLTRGGRRRLMVPRSQIPARHRTTFQACVYRATGRRRHFEIYEMPLREPLPTINVPLRDKDVDARIDLQPLVQRAYESGAYDDIDYAAPPIPPLRGKDAEWADALLKAAGRR